MREFRDRKPFRRSFALACALSALCVTVAAPSVLKAQSSDTTFNVPRNAVIDITLRTGRLVVRGTDRATGELRGLDQRYELRTTGVGVIVAPRDRGDRMPGSRSARNYREDRDEVLELAVPRGVRLVISAGSADVDVQDIAGDVEVHSLSGDIELRGIGGRTIIETLSGDVQLVGGAGDTRTTTMSGDVVLRGVRGTAHVHTTSGEVTLSMLRASDVQVESTSGDIVFDGEPTDDARMQLTTHSGDVTVRIPESAHGTMEISTFSGEIQSSRTLTMTSSGGSTRDRTDGSRSERGTQRFEFGGGGPARLVISTFNGDVSIGRRVMRNPD